jgi:hypothetical protein
MTEANPGLDSQHKDTKTPTEYEANRRGHRERREVAWNLGFDALIVSWCLDVGISAQPGHSTTRPLFSFGLEFRASDFVLALDLGFGYLAIRSLLDSWMFGDWLLVPRALFAVSSLKLRDSGRQIDVDSADFHL